MREERQKNRRTWEHGKQKREIRIKKKERGRHIKERRE